MKKQADNPFLPIDVCIPDGEAHVFGNRVYLFGSHERPGGERFCCLDYEFYSAPVNDLSEWTSRGINYRATQDPDYGEKYDVMYAPDVVCGTDGRYYLYYAMSGKAFTGPIHVAVCDEPDGKYEFYGAVRNPDGSVYQSNISFDPAVINDGGTIRLYYGWALAVKREKALELANSKSDEQLYPIYTMLFGKTPEQLRNEPGGLMGAFTVELCPDMLTVQTAARRIVPGQFDSFGTEFENHAFFEASSIRKIDDKYYFIYSSENQHELCYAVSGFPDRDFHYGGVIISNGDIGYNGRSASQRIAATGNNHGCIEYINGRWYVFYHRQTHAHCFSRQACAEKISIAPNGSIAQVCVSSCGLNSGALLAEGELSAACCCGLTNGKMPHLEVQKSSGDIASISHEGSDWFISKMSCGTTAIWRWLSFDRPTELSVCYRGTGGTLCVEAGAFSSTKLLEPSAQWREQSFELGAVGTQELKITYLGSGSIDILKIVFQNGKLKGGNRNERLDSMEKYRNSALDPAERARDLLSRLSTQEKVRQISCSSIMMIMPFEMQNLDNGTGSATIGLSGECFADDVRAAQNYIMEHSAHHIPALFHTEGLAGPLCLFGGSQYPISIGLGATFSPEIVEKMSQFTRRQLLANGVRHALSPVADLARDLRWGRCNETYGNDPTLSAAMSVAFVRGLQGDDPKNGVAACCKHFLGYSSSEGALNCHQTVLSGSQIREQYAKPFEAAINEAGVMTVMNSYAIVDGRPVTANGKILTELLRRDMGFDGVVVADYGSISQLLTPYCLAENNAQAAQMALKAGLDVELPDHVIYADELAAAADRGEVDMALIDRAALRMLTLKFKLGLFENPYTIGDYASAMDNTEPNQGSLEAAIKSITLLKNDGILPIEKRKTRLAVIGPVADSLRMMYSHYTAAASREMIALLMRQVGARKEDADFTNVLNQGREEERQVDGGAPQPRSIEDRKFFNDEIRRAYPEAKTILEALQERFGSLKFEPGCDYKGDDESQIARAVKLAKRSEIVVLAVGEKNGIDASCTSGEGLDTTSLTLPGVQDKLVQAVYAVNKNIVLVHTGSRPLCWPWAYEHIPAIIEAWLPCTYGGEAIAGVITGEYNPAGRTPVDLPRSAAHTPVYHSQYRGSSADDHIGTDGTGYISDKSTSLRPFGYGLSYTDFAYEDGKISADSNGNIEISVRVRNTGERDGDEVVQLYGTDLIASMARPRQELIGFKRVFIPAKQSTVVRFSFNIDILSFIAEDGQWIVEAGDFGFFLGSHSKDRRIELGYSLPKTRMVDPNHRCFYAQTK